MSTELSLFAAEPLDEEQRAKLGIRGETIEDRLENQRDTSTAERQEILDTLPSVVIGSTRYEFPERFPNVLGNRVQRVDDAVIQRVEQLADDIETAAEDDAHADPNVDGVLAFLRERRGEEVFVHAR